MKFQFKIIGTPADVARGMNFNINHLAKSLTFADKTEAESWAETWIKHDIYMTHNREQFELYIFEVPHAI